MPMATEEEIAKMEDVDRLLEEKEFRKLAERAWQLYLSKRGSTLASDCFDEARMFSDEEIQQQQDMEIKNNDRRAAYAKERQARKP